MKIATSIQLSACQDGHIHIELTDENDKVFVEFILADKAEVQQLIEMLNDALKDIEKVLQ